MPTTDRAGRDRRAPDPAAVRSRLPSHRALVAAGLVAVESTHDGRRHVVHESHYAGELTSGVRPRIRGLCGDLLLLGSLTTEPAPPCTRCATAAPGTAVAPAGRPSRLRDRVWNRVRPATGHVSEPR